MSKHGKYHIGTSGWSYTSWRTRFYPKGLPPSRWLGHLAQHFDTVEINSSFYRIPKPQFVERWASQVPPEFLFSAKLWRGITHLKKLLDSEDLLATYFDSLNRLGERRGPLLIQLPPSMKENQERFAGFLKSLQHATRGHRWPLVVEVRHPSWLQERFLKMLTDHGIALCLADWPTCPTTQPNDVKFVYVRRHGTMGTYAGSYTPEQIQQDAHNVRRWLHAGKDVFVYYNNDIEGHAVQNARQLIEAVGKR